MSRTVMVQDWDDTTRSTSRLDSDSLSELLNNPHVYHDPSNLQSTFGMVETTMEQAEYKEITPCTKCYPNRQQLVM